MSSSSDESESDSDIPEVSVGKCLCEEFAEITNSDTACEDRKLDLEQSLSDFFEDIDNKGAVRVNKKRKAEVVVLLDEISFFNGLAAAALAESALSQGSRVQNKSSKSGATLDLDSKPTSSTLKFITWNIEGLNKRTLKQRTKDVCKYIEDLQADIVFLQEVVPESAELLRCLPGYHSSFANEVGYFVGILLKKSTVNYKDTEIIDFENSRMMRNMLKVNVTFKELRLCLINSHLEHNQFQGYYDGSEERKHQLRAAFKEVLKVDKKETVIFAGDMSLRDKELGEVGGLPAGIEDLWETCGSRKECFYTFDMTRNDNNFMYGSKLKPRYRFDRVYFRHSSPAKLQPVFFGLIGLKRVFPYTCFPSSHWGILCYFKMK